MRVHDESSKICELFDLLDKPVDSNNKNKTYDSYVFFFDLISTN